ncbi:MAG: mechanosensitive ion channel family protein [Cyclobacteriaceae bacterium]
MKDYLNQSYWNNSVQEYLLAFGSILLGIILIKIFKRYIFKSIKNLTKKTDTNVDDYLVESIDKYVIPAVYFYIIYLGIKALELSPKFMNTLSVAFHVIITYYAIRMISNTLRIFLQSYVRKQENGEEKVKQIGGILLILNVIIWGMGILFFLDNRGFDVTAIVTGMGIGGIAIALAAQNILGDLFNYFVIFFDRPVEIGDFVVIDDKNGIVDKIGIKTTRIKTLSGEQLVVANGDLTSSRIHNFKKMQTRRIVFSIGVSYETSPENLRKIPGVLKEIVNQQSPVNFDRAHFKSYGDSSLDFEVVYIIQDPNYNTYMDIQQEINFAIFERFAAMGVIIAFPTRTLYVRNETDQSFKIEGNTPPDNKEPESQLLSDS